MKLRTDENGQFYPYDEGATTFRLGYPRTNCPACYTPGQRGRWKDGWDEAWLISALGFIERSGDGVLAPVSRPEAMKLFGEMRQQRLIKLSAKSDKWRLTIAGRALLSKVVLSKGERK